MQGYEIVLTGPHRRAERGGVAAGAGTSNTPGVLPDSIPERLRSRVEPGSGQHDVVHLLDDPLHRRPAGGPRRGDRLAGHPAGRRRHLHALLPLPDDRAAGHPHPGAPGPASPAVPCCSSCVGGLTWLVTRQVVTPVRLARRVAERLASGRLEERMHVRGDDDIARLGTSFNQMAASLQKQIRQLEELSRVQRRFVSDVSHELRTPLTTVRMAGDVLHDARDRFDPPTARAAELLQNELDRFEMLLADLLEISRFDAGAAVLDLEDVNLVRPRAPRGRVHAAPLAERRGTVVVVRAGERPCVAEVDPRRVERIVRNLVTNAIDYADSSDVVVMVESNDEATALAVRDHGVGLRPGDAAMVFNRFWRADPARARTTGGTGLGLSISLEDAHLHGGWLQAWGEPGGGAQFRLTLPRRAGDRIGASPLPLVPEDAAARHGRRRTTPAWTAGPPAGRRAPREPPTVPSRLAGLLVLLALALSGCVGLPAGRRGPQTVRAATRRDGDTLVDFTPGGPKPGSAPVPLVDNFLRAMTATPAEHLRGPAVPDLGEQQLLGARARHRRLRRRHRSRRCRTAGSRCGSPTSWSSTTGAPGWATRPGAPARDYTLKLVKEDGEWRISDPPEPADHPAARTSTREYQQYFLYFFDKSAQVLVPEPVYVPARAPGAHAAGRRAAQGPAAERWQGVETTFVPARHAARRDLGAGLAGQHRRGAAVRRGARPRRQPAQPAVRPAVLDARPDRRGRADAGHRRRHAGRPPRWRASTSASTSGSEFDPALAWASTSMFGIRDRRVVTLTGDRESRVSGPFGTLPLGLRSIAVDLPAQHVAGVSADGTRVLEADKDRTAGKPATPADVRTVYSRRHRPAPTGLRPLRSADRDGPDAAGARLSVVRAGDAAQGRRRPA